MELRISGLNPDFAKQTIGKERAALFRHYRVVARPDVFSARVKRGNSDPVSVFYRDNAVEAH